MGDDQSAEFQRWKRAPDQSVVGAVVGLVLAWITGGSLILGMVATPGETAGVSGMGFLLTMVRPVAIAVAACAVRRVRFWAGAFVPGATFGWILGCLTFLVLALLSMAM